MLNQRRVWLYQYFKMATKQEIELASINATPDILPSNTKFESYIGENVINLLSIQLSEHQVRALGKGLTFCPTPGHPEKFRIWEDFKEFHRILELMQFFNELKHNEEVDMPQSIIDFMNENAQVTQKAEPTDPYKDLYSKFKNKSTWKPNPPNKTLDVFKRSFKMNLLKAQIANNTKGNLTKQERLRLTELANNPNIVIKKTDKGSAVVVMQTTDYLREEYRQLSDREFYTKLKEDPTINISQKICNVLTQMKNLKLITEKNFDYLNINEPKAGRFYLLPKIHKKNIPGRPICSSICHPTYNISKFVDAHIKDYVPKTKSYVRHTLSAD